MQRHSPSLRAETASGSLLPRRYAPGRARLQPRRPQTARQNHAARRRRSQPRQSAAPEACDASSVLGHRAFASLFLEFARLLLEFSENLERVLAFLRPAQLAIDTSQQVVISRGVRVDFRCALQCGKRFVEFVATVEGL